MITFDNKYANLPASFAEAVRLSAVPNPQMVRCNRALAKALGVESDWLESEEGVSMLAGTWVPEGAQPVAQAYGGHQFGGWVPRLGDGRAVLLGEVRDPSGQYWDIALKGSGRTPFSRGGDGKATLGAVIREYVLSEAMAALGIPTTRALAVVTTGEMVPRQEMHPGGILTRVAASHIRVGTFQYLLAQEEVEAIRTLADFAIQRHYPDLADAEEPYLRFFEEVARRQARLIAHWMQVGFIHGVMNTDNMVVSGETIDYGPCAFMEWFDPKTVFSSIDVYGRYAWMNQPSIGHWNLERLGDAIAVLLGDNEGIGRALELYKEEFKHAYFGGFGAKFGVEVRGEKEGDFVAASLQFLAEQELDFTLFFTTLTRFVRGDIAQEDVLRFIDGGEGAADWFEEWQGMIAGDAAERMAKANPVRIARNHRVEAAIVAAESGDYSVFERLVSALENPYEEDERLAEYEAPALPHEEVKATFCGT